MEETHLAYIWVKTKYFELQLATNLVFIIRFHHLFSNFYLILPHPEQVLPLAIHFHLTITLSVSEVLTGVISEKISGQ